MDKGEMVGRHLRRIFLTVLLGGFLSAILVRFAPGFEVDEQQMDPRWRQESIERMTAARRADGNPAAFYARFLGRYLRGDLGLSASLGRPVRALLAERAPLTAAVAGGGMLAAWVLALATALAGARFPRGWLDGAAALSALVVQCIPTALLALLLIVAGGRGVLAAGAALALVLYARLAIYLRGIVQHAAGAPHVLLARARGLGPWRALFRHALPAAAPQLISLAGVSLSLALSAAVPVELLLDVAGLGQLTWHAALARDLNLLVNLVLAASLAIMGANLLAEVAARAASRP